MEIYSNKAGKTFALKVSMLGLDIYRQIEALNKIYQGKVEFCKWTGIYNFSGGPAICIKRTAEEIEDLELPECEYIKAECLFHYEYEGNVKTIRLPHCLTGACLGVIAQGIVGNRRLRRIVIPPETKCNGVKGCTVVRKPEDGSVQKETVIISTHTEPLT